MLIEYLKTLGPYLDVILRLSQLIGIPIAIGLYVYNKQKERREREYATYNALDDKYIDYLKLCLANPHLDVADLPKRVVGQLSNEQQHREKLVFGVLVSILERAYLMYGTESEEIKARQWKGWERYLMDWCGRANFVNYVNELPTGFDAEFVTYLKKTLKENCKP